MKKNYKVSIVTITYNHEKFIRQALDSFLAQKINFPIEIIVADDCSKDKTPQIIEEYANKYPEIVRPIIRKENIGAIANSIESLNEASGDYIALCEGDDYWTDTSKLQRQVDFLDKHQDYELCFHTTSVVFENNEKKSSVWPHLDNKSELSVRELVKENFIPTNSVVFRKQNYENLPHNVMPLDWYLHLYNAQFGKIGFINRTMSVYRRHKDGLWWQSDFDKDELLKKHGVGNVAMYVELLKLYGNDPELKSIITASLSKMATELAGTEERHKTGLLKEVIEKYPEVPKTLMINSYHMQQKHTEELADQKVEIDKLNQEILDLRSNIFELRNELHGLKNSRLLGKIIKARNIAGEARKEIPHFPRKVLHKTRVVVAPAIPAPARKAVKHAYRKGRGLVGSKQTSPKTIETVTNKLWDKKAPLVSVVIAYYNAAKTIDETLSSLKKQTFQHFEVIIVNDGSTDNKSIEKLASLDTGDLEVNVISQHNQGPAIARNNGIAKARGKYIISLDADDLVEPTYIEKSTLLLETNPDASVTTTHKYMFGVVNEEYKNHEYNPKELYSNNMVICAAEFRKEAWSKTGGYKPSIGYEDWEFWLNLAEHGFWGRLIPEKLFKYRTSLQSRYVEDQDIHWSNIKNIRALHPEYKKTVKTLEGDRLVKHVVSPRTAFINVDNPEYYLPETNERKNVLITTPWMTFGGAETLIYNYCREIKDKFNITFITGLKSEHEWEYKFKEITPHIYHMPNLFEDPALYLEFISNYIATRAIDTLHVIHNGFMFDMLPELRKRYPDLEIIVTMFNDHVEYFEQSLGFKDYVDTFASDNARVANHYKKELGNGSEVVVIPNGIDCYHEFNPKLFDRETQRESLDIGEQDTAIFFVGRLSEEKNPDVFVEAAKDLLEKSGQDNLKFFVIGDGPMRSAIEVAIKKLNSTNIKYLGYQSEVARYLSAADIFVLPSSTEGFPLSILEAMAMQVVVIASDVGAVAEVISSGTDGFVVTPGSANEIAQTIGNLVGKRDLMQKVKTAGRKSVENKYSNLVLGKNYEHLYSDVVKLQ